MPKIVSKLETDLRDEYNFGLFMTTVFNNINFGNRIYKIGVSEHPVDPDIYEIHIFRDKPGYHLLELLTTRKNHEDLKLLQRLIFQLVNMVNILHQSNIFNIYDLFAAEIHKIKTADGKRHAKVILKDFKNTCTFDDAKKLPKCQQTAEELRSIDTKNLINIILSLWFPDKFFEEYLKTHSNSFGTLELMENGYLKFLNEFRGILGSIKNVADFRKKFGTENGRNRHKYLSINGIWKMCLNICLWFESEILQKAIENKNNKKITEYKSYLEWAVYKTDLGSNSFSINQFANTIDSPNEIPVKVISGQTVKLLDNLPNFNASEIRELKRFDVDYESRFTNYLKTPLEIKDKIQVLSEKINAIQAEIAIANNRLRELRKGPQFDPKKPPPSVSENLRKQQQIDSEWLVISEKLTKLDQNLAQTRFALDYWKSKI